MSGNQEFEERLMNIEMALANQERMLDDLNQVVIEQGKIIDLLQKQSQYLLAHMNEETVKPLSEEASQNRESRRRRIIKKERKWNLTPYIS